jgi:hypothetical protein
LNVLLEGGILFIKNRFSHVNVIDDGKAPNDRGISDESVHIKISYKRDNLRIDLIGLQEILTAIKEISLNFVKYFGRFRINRY